MKMKLLLLATSPLWLSMCVLAFSKKSAPAYKPQAPEYNLEGVSISNFTSVPGFDSNGLPTSLLYMNLSIQWSMKSTSPASFYYVNGGLAQAGYGPIPVLSLSGFSSGLLLGPNAYANFSTPLTTDGYPLYEVAHLLKKDLENGYLVLDIRAQLASYVAFPFDDKQFMTKALCAIAIDPLKLLFINGTCTSV